MLIESSENVSYRVAKINRRSEVNLIKILFAYDRNNSLRGDKFLLTVR